MRQQIVEKKPELKDVKSTAQLSWRHMFLKAVALWHALSAEEKAEWESAATPRHMTGYAWFVSQALRPNPGIYLPLQGGIMQGLIDMDGYAIQDMLDPVAAQDADTKAARDAAIAAAIGGSLTCDIYGYDGSNWQKLLVESAAQHNLRVKLFDGANGLDTALLSESPDPSDRALLCYSYLTAFNIPTGSARVVFIQDVADGFDNIRGLVVNTYLRGFNGSTWDRLRSYGTGILKVGRAEIDLSDIRLTAVGQIKGSAGNLYWMLLNPGAGNSVVELTDSLAAGAAIKVDHFDTTRDGHMVTFDPPLEFATGIYLETFTNMTSVTFGYK